MKKCIQGTALRSVSPWTVLGLFFCFSSATMADSSPVEIPLVGVDHDGHSKVVKIPEAQYVEKLSSTLQSVDQTLVPALKQRACKKESGGHFDLTTVAVGLSIEFEAGLGAIFSVGASGKVQLVYSNQWDPVLPE